MNNLIVTRKLIPPALSFFLFGPRGVGKSTWLANVLPEAFRVDLLNSELYLELTRSPHRLEALVGVRPPGAWVVIDEIQRVPELLNEVHRLIESRGWRFALCGSSARKLKRGGANLLAGRAITLNMESFSMSELGAHADLQRAIEYGLLPIVYRSSDNAADILAAYVQTYLAEEIREEGVVRSIPPFVRFLAVAGQMNGQMVNGHNISREAAVARSTVDAYFTILLDTLLGHFLPAWRPGLKVREAAHPKFYWFDSGAARAAAGLLRDPVDRVWQGASLETLVFHELRIYNETTRRFRPVNFYRTASGVEVDFVIETSRRAHGMAPRIVCVEVKLSTRWDRQWEKPMRDLAAQQGVCVERMIGVYCGVQRYHFDGVEVMPAVEFFDELHSGNIF